MADQPDGGLSGGAIKARLLKSQTFTGTDADTLDTAVNTWTAGAGEKTVVAILSGGGSTLLTITIFYTEG